MNFSRRNVLRAIAVLPLMRFVAPSWVEKQIALSQAAALVAITDELIAEYAAVEEIVRADLARCIADANDRTGFET